MIAFFLIFAEKLYLNTNLAQYAEDEMVEKDTITKERLRQAGIGKFKDIYLYAYNWLVDNDFAVIEEMYEEKVGPNGKDLAIEWSATKTLTDYYRANLKIKWKILGLSDVEVEIDGVRKKTNKFVELTIDAKGILEKDYRGKWETSSFSRFLSDMYHKYIVYERTEQKEGEVLDYVKDFLEDMKAFMDITGRR